MHCISHNYTQSNCITSVRILHNALQLTRSYTKQVHHFCQINTVFNDLLFLACWLCFSGQRVQQEMVHCVGGTACTKGNKTIIMIGGLQHCSRQLTRKERKQSEKVPSIREEKRDLGRLWGGGCFLFFVLLLLPTTSLQLEFLKKKKKKKRGKERTGREKERKEKKNRWGKRKREVRIQNVAYQWMMCFFFYPNSLIFSSSWVTDKMWFSFTSVVCLFSVVCSQRN